MKPEDFKLRGHHLLNLILGSADNYHNLEDGLRKKKCPGDDVQRAFSDEDVTVGPKFYRAVIANPDNSITIVAGVGDRCKVCSNYDGQGCSLYTREELNSEDERSLDEFFPNLSIGDTALVFEVFASYQHPDF